MQMGPKTLGQPTMATSSYTSNAAVDKITIECYLLQGTLTHDLTGTATIYQRVRLGPCVFPRT